MKTTTIRYLELLKNEYKLENQNQIAKFLNVRPSRIGNYYQGIRQFDNYMSAKIADLLNLNFNKILTEIEIEKSKNENERSFWSKKAKLIALASIVFILPNVASSLELEKNNKHLTCYTLYEIGKCIKKVLQSIISIFKINSIKPFTYNMGI